MSHSNHAAILFTILVLHSFNHHVHATPTHIVAILADDFGWSDAGWHSHSSDVVTPHMNALISSGINLQRNYVHKYCSPTRSAIQSGRHPMHVNVMNINPNYYNPNDPISGYSGIPRNMTGLGALMKRGNYRTVFAGKWDAGMATMQHTPRGRGYDESLHYFHHMNDYWMQFYVGNVGPAGGINGGSAAVRCGPNVSSYPSNLPAPVDLWLNQNGIEGPAIGLNGSAKCAAEPPANKHVPGAPEINTCPENDDGSSCPPYPGFPGKQVDGCKYEDELFLDFVLNAINNHNTSDVETPLFLFWSPHIAHTPLQVPKLYLDKFAYVTDWRRRRYLAMVNYLDDGIGKVVAALKLKGMYNDTLITFSADNGGPVYGNGTSGGSNWPLKGGKASNWEGGIRVNGFVSGGILPTTVRGTESHGLVTPWDWWKTFAEVGEIQDTTDHTAKAAGLPPVDGVSQWSYWSGKHSTPPRTELAVATCSTELKFDLWCTNPNGTTVVGGVIVDEGVDGIWKLIKQPTLAMSGWQGPSWPNSTTTHFIDYKDTSCGGTNGCLYQIDVDPTEHHNVANQLNNRERIVRMTTLLKTMNATTFSPDRGTGPDFELSCGVAHKRWKNFWGPFVDL